MVEAYLVRAALAAVCLRVIAPPRDVPLRALPGMIPRAAFITAHFLFILVGVQDGNPAVVQTAVATAPLFSLGIEAADHATTAVGAADRRGRAGDDRRRGDPAGGVTTGVRLE